MAIDRGNRYCIIGAGASGLTVAKNFKQQGLAFDCLEKADDIGGNWRYGHPGSSVYQSTNLISSKRLTEYVDFPMPDEYPHFPDHRQVFDYLAAYARQFDLLGSIEFNQPVTGIVPHDGGRQWEVALEGGERRLYRGVVIANGHHWDPKVPTYPGAFSGLVLHSAQYKTPDVLRGKQVLVVGAGNSGCDIAVEAAQNAAATFHSTRRGYHYLPKFLLGKPIDVSGERLLRWRLPLWLRRRITAALVKLALGKPEDYGLPRPDHKLLETHPIINSQMLYYLGHGKIRPKPDVAELAGDKVRFADGSVERIDVLIYATGFRISFPFIAEEHLNWRDGRPQLYLHAFHPLHDNLFVAGMIQPDSGIWGLVDYQAQLIAKFVAATSNNPRGAERFRRLKATAREDLASGIHYVASPRHQLEVEHFSYRRKLKRLIAGFN